MPCACGPAQDLAAGKGQAGIECQLAWVTPSFSHYETRFFDLPGGTYDARDLQFPLTAPQALRAIRLTPRVGRGAKGSIRLSRVSVTDARGTEHVVDPEFAQWYEPLPPELRKPVDDGCGRIREGLLTLEKSIGQSGPGTRQAVTEILSRSTDIRQLIRRSRVENGCRRVLRDLETIGQHLQFVVP